jgi:hypothetical protein
MDSGTSCKATTIVDYEVSLFVLYSRGVSWNFLPTKNLAVKVLVVGDPCSNTVLVIGEEPARKVSGIWRFLGDPIAMRASQVPIQKSTRCLLHALRSSFLQFAKPWRPLFQGFGGWPSRPHQDSSYATNVFARHRVRLPRAFSRYCDRLGAMQSRLSNRTRHLGSWLRRWARVQFTIHKTLQRSVHFLERVLRASPTGCWAVPSASMVSSCGVV